MKRSLTLGVSILFHVALIAGGVIHGFWHVPELQPPRIPVIIAPPQPPPPGPAFEEGRPGHPPRAVKIEKKAPDEIVAPADPEPVAEQKPSPTEDPAAADPDEFVNNMGTGTGLGLRGSGPGGGGLGGRGIGHGLAPTSEAPTPRTLPPHVGRARLVSGAMPERPAAVRRLGVRQVVLAKICVDVVGAVASVSILKGAEPIVDQAVVATVRTWRYRPYSIDGRAVPFCTAARFDFQVAGP